MLMAERAGVVVTYEFWTCGFDGEVVCGVVGRIVWGGEGRWAMGDG